MSKFLLLCEQECICGPVFLTDTSVEKRCASCEKRLLLLACECGRIQFMGCTCWFDKNGLLVLPYRGDE